MKQWGLKMGERGIYNVNTAKQRVLALEQLTSVLGNDESRDPTWILANVETISKRWATRENANPNTVRTYESKVRRILEDFFAYQADPTAFQSSTRPQQAERQERKARPKSSTPTSSEPARPTQGESGSADFREFPLSDGREFRYSLPENLSIKDVRRIAFHLLTFAEDFDPTNPGSFGLVKRDD